MTPNKINHIFRINNWWTYIIPPILGFVYMTIYLKNIDFRTAVINLSFFFLLIISTAIFGFFYNDFTDIEVDRKAGKNNFASRFSPLVRLIILGLALLITLIPCYFLPFSKITIILLSLQFFLLFVYSNPITRLKNKMIAGLIADALYSNLIFILLGIFIFNQLTISEINHLPLYIGLITAAAFMKGLRNILMHQLSDRKKDMKANQKTFVTANGGLSALNLIVKIIFPAELFFLILFSVIASYQINYYFFLPLLFVFFTISKHRLWEKFRLNKRHFKFMFLNLPNDFLEEWLPVFFLILLTCNEPLFGIILLIHLTLFFSIVKKFMSDLTNIVSNHLKDFIAFKKKVLHI